MTAPSHYYLATHKGELRINSDSIDTPAAIAKNHGFIRLAPEITSEKDITPAYITALISECEKWPLTPEEKAKVKANAQDWIDKHPQGLI